MMIGFRAGPVSSLRHPAWPHRRLLVSSLLFSSPASLPTLSSSFVRSAAPLLYSSLVVSVLSCPVLSGLCEGQRTPCEGASHAVPPVLLRVRITPYYPPNNDHGTEHSSVRAPPLPSLFLAIQGLQPYPSPAPEPVHARRSCELKQLDRDRRRLARCRIQSETIVMPARRGSRSCSRRHAQSLGVLAVSSLALVSNPP